MTKRNKAGIDPEIVEFEAALLRSVDAAMRGEGRRTTPDMIAARKAGRPVGNVKVVVKKPNDPL